MIERRGEENCQRAAVALTRRQCVIVRQCCVIIPVAYAIVWARLAWILCNVNTCKQIALLIMFALFTFNRRYCVSNRAVHHYIQQRHDCDTTRHLWQPLILLARWRYSTDVRTRLTRLLTRLVQTALARDVVRVLTVVLAPVVACAFVKWNIRGLTDRV